MNDRTNEFMSLARSMPNAGAASMQARSQSSASDGTNKANSNVELRQFHKTAADISRDIAATSAMLSELAQLVRKKSLFLDDTQHINSLVMRIKSNVESLNGRLDEAGAVIAQQKRKLGKNSQAGQEALNVVGQLKEEFGEAAAGFKKVLQQRTDTMKETTDMKRQVYGADNDDDPGDVPVLNLENKPPVYSHSLSTPLAGAGMNNSNNNLQAPMSFNNFPTLDLTSGMSAGESSSSASQLPRPHGASAYDTGAYGVPGSGMRLRHSNSDPMPPAYSGSYSTYNNAGNTPLTPLDIQRMETESGQQQQMQLIPDQDYLRERADAMSQVETQMVELGTIFNKLAVMVSEHRDMVQKVEDDVDDANTNINLSLNTLTDTLHSLQTNRALFFKILAVLVVFIIGFVIFLA
ncbi:Syntaxin-5 [Seminavis robusta]|uniref:Syntaxin-5 n=1 Tax=Seminavis robusta TaxID=568900 RepID=A0A9N8EG42_9STRA|nr:Syntaxin-5 [Seminavis robusta]|eukprot:Sro940_g222570.1 Syntaxin-5 (407) ;mRNA; r:17182-18510